MQFFTIAIVLSILIRKIKLTIITNATSNVEIEGRKFFVNNYEVLDSNEPTFNCSSNVIIYFMVPINEKLRLQWLT